MITFYSHSKLLPDKRVVGSKLLLNHTNGVCQKANASFLHKLTFGESTEDLISLLRDICLYHDLGKYTTYFQDYLLQSGDVDFVLKQHAKFGAYAIQQKYAEADIKKSLIALFIIVHHHGNLSNFQKLPQLISDSENKKVFEEQKKVIESTLLQIIEELKEPELKKYLSYPESKLFIRTINLWLQREPDIKYYYLINYLFSLLIEADKLDASDTPIYNKLAIPADLVDNFIGKPIHPPLTDLAKLEQNQLRNYARAKVLENLNNPAILDTKLFTLTAPTGIGKTLMALDFALKLRSQIQERENREAQIIYALPFINIIEQSIKVYNDVLKEKANVLAHYQYADALEQQAENEEKDYSQKVMTLDTWQCDIVITTFVQFLQTLIGNRNKLLKKFNHYAGAIIILDEVQTIKLSYLPLIGAAIYYLAKFMDARIILMTATKPKIFDLANEFILEPAEERAKPQELLTTYEKVFSQFNRTCIIPLLNHKIDDNNYFLEQIFFDKWHPDKSCLVVCNTVNRSIDIFNLIEQNVENPVYYLSTNIVPAHRLEIIRKVKDDIKAGYCPILVSTQAVEAGVDLDFDMGFRDLAPIDSIVQVAGRVNRNNNKNKLLSPVYIVDFGDCKKIYDIITETQSRHSLNNYSEGIKEENYLSLINEYYNNISNRSSFDISKKIFNSMKMLNYDDDDESVSAFRVIEDKGFAISVFIEVDDKAMKAREAFEKMINKKEVDFGREQFEPFKKDFHQYTIAIPKYLEKARGVAERKMVLCEGIYYVPQDQVDDFYNLTTGFIRTAAEKNQTYFL